MPDNAFVSSLLDRFSASSQRLVELVSDLPNETLDRSSGEGEWTIRQIIHHLADDGDVYSFVIKRALFESGSEIRMGHFPGNEPWANTLHTDRRPVAPAIRLIAAHRESIRELVSEFPDRLGQTAVFIGEDGGKFPFTVEAMIAMLADHMEEHLNTIDIILA